MIAPVLSEADSSIAIAILRRGPRRAPRVPAQLVVLTTTLLMTAVTVSTAAAAAPGLAAPAASADAGVDGGATPVPAATSTSTAVAVPALVAVPAPTAGETPHLDASSGEKPITRRWWFWTVIGAAVIGGVVSVFLLDQKPGRPACPSAQGFTCPP